MNGILGNLRLANTWGNSMKAFISGGENAFNYVAFVVAVLTLVVNVNNNINNNNNNLNQVRF